MAKTALYIIHFKKVGSEELTALFLPSGYIRGI